MIHITSHKSLRHSLFWVISESISWLLFFIVYLTSLEYLSRCVSHISWWICEDFSRNIHLKQNVCTTFLWRYHIRRGTDTLKCEESTISYPSHSFCLLSHHDVSISALPWILHTLAQIFEPVSKIIFSSCKVFLLHILIIGMQSY